MASDGRMDFGIFMAPFHRVGENPSLAMHRDLELIEWLDQLGYDEAWIGEHHSAGWELIASPEVFIAAAAERTRSIRLGTGVISLPYHHPLMVVDRMIQLDHMTRGRAMMGVGPGALSSDAAMMGIDPLTQRGRMDESLSAIMALLRQDGPVNIETDWFSLTDARIQVSPYTKPHFEMAAASTVSPAGRMIAGKYGIGLLSIGVYLPGGRSNLAGQWSEVEQFAEQHGQAVDRNKWRLVMPMYIADDRQRAYDESREGYRAWQIDYFRDTLQAAIPGVAETPEGAVENGAAIIGTPDDAIAAIEQLYENADGFGGLMMLAHEWADREQIRRSFELFARYVAPRFQGQLDSVQGTQQWVAGGGGAVSFSRNDVLIKAFEDAGQDVPDFLRQTAAPEPQHAAD